MDHAPEERRLCLGYFFAGCGNDEIIYLKRLVPRIVYPGAERTDIVPELYHPVLDSARSFCHIIQLVGKPVEYGMVGTALAGQLHEFV